MKSSQHFKSSVVLLLSLVCACPVWATSDFVLIDDTDRLEENLGVAGLVDEVPLAAQPQISRQIGVQVIRPTVDSCDEGKQYPVILFSGGLSENYRLYSTVLNNLAASGYFVVNIDHYYFQDSADQASTLVDATKEIRKKINPLNGDQVNRRYRVVLEKTFDLFYPDQLLVLGKLKSILQKYPEADTSRIALMGHSLGAMAWQKVLQILGDDGRRENGILALVSLDSNFGLLGFDKDFPIQTLLLKAQAALPSSNQIDHPNLTVVPMSGATHISFDDVAIMGTLGRDLSKLVDGFNPGAKEKLNDDIQKIQKGVLKRFGKDLFVGTVDDMLKFLRNLNDNIVLFLQRQDLHN